ncbi:MAG: flagellar filament outer layer protein FlaA [Spirochaetales bacterium]|nr:flagellar filament outer layer protein FlaA [Spirochaetales bacterium]
MKRFGLLLLLVLCSLSWTVVAEEAVLIDFAILTADTDDGQNEATVIDFADKAGSSFTDEEKLAMRTSLAIENWGVVLASSSRTVENQRYSYTKEAPVKETSRKYAGETIMGVRVHFPDEPYNSWAMIKPPFEIPAYEKKDDADLYGDKFTGYGVVKNVGVIKSVSVNILGSNFPNGLGLVLKDQNNQEQIIFVDYLDFDGWRTLTWENPNYIEEVRNREIQKFPLYPRTAPMRKLIGLVFYKDSTQSGGDFITYVKDITMTYDLAVLTLESDVDHEALWGILDQRETSRRTAEFERLGNIQVLQYLEKKKMHQETAINEEEAEAPEETE